MTPNPAMSMTRRLASSVAWAAAGNWSCQLVSFLVYMLLARQLGPESYGLVGMTNVATALAYTLVFDGTASYIVRADELEPGHIDAVFWLQASAAGVVTLGMIVGGEPLARFYAEPPLAAILLALAVLPVLYGIAGVPSSLLQRATRFGSLAAISLGCACLAGGIGLYMAFAGYGVWSLVGMNIGQWAAQAICLSWAARWRPGIALRRRHLRDVVSFARHALSVKGLIFIDQQLPRIAVGATLGAESLGILTMAWRMTETMLWLTARSISQVSIPYLARLQIKDSVAGALVEVLQITVAVGVPCFVGLAVVAPIMVPIFFGAKWVGAIPIIQLAAGIGVAWTVLSCLDAAMLARGEMARRTRIALGSTIALVLALGAVLPFGLAAVVAALALREAGECLAYLVLLERAGYGIGGAILRRMAPFAAAAALMAASVVSWRHLFVQTLSPASLLATAVAVGAFTYAGAAIVLSPGLVARLRRSASLVRVGRGRMPHDAAQTARGGPPMTSPPILADYREIGRRRGPVAVENRPRVSVVTVTLNAAATLGRTIDSVQGQTFGSIEHIVVDGGSSDGTVNMLANRLRPKDFWISEKDRGISDAFNKGVALARGEMIQFLNADDWLSPDQIEHGVATLDRTGADFVYGDLIFYEANRPSFRYLGDPDYARKLPSRMPTLNHPTVVARLAAFERIGLFAPIYHQAMEYDWFLRLHKAGGGGVHDPAIVGHMTQEGVSNRQFLQTIDEVRRIAVAHGRSALPAYLEALLRGLKTRSSFVIRERSESFYRLTRRVINRSYRLLGDHG
jgi:O-antigen/teichoic acid export membrane protein/glycosyltransferase involved in cell wall biosynthesis